jgi:hypothetical protein
MARLAAAYLPRPLLPLSTGRGFDVGCVLISREIRGKPLVSPQSSSAPYALSMTEIVLATGIELDSLGQHVAVSVEKAD